MMELIERLASARREVSECADERDVAEAKMVKCRQLLQETMDAQAAITERRLSGSSPREDAAEFAALQGDREALGAALVIAAASHDASLAALRDAEHTALVVEQEHQRMLGERTLTESQSRARLLDEALVAAIRAVHDAGAKVGRQRLSEVYRPSPELDRCLRYGVRP